MNEFNVFIDFGIFASGVYFLYAAYVMKKRGEIPSLLLSKDMVLKKAADKAGFAGNMFGKTIAIGILGLLAGSIGLYNDFYRSLGEIPVAAMMVYVVGLMLYGYLLMRAQKKYLQV